MSWRKYFDIKQPDTRVDPPKILSEEEKEVRREELLRELDETNALLAKRRPMPTNIMLADDVVGVSPMCAPKFTQEDIAKWKEKMTQTMQAEIYTKSTTYCGFCVKAKAILEYNNIPYREISVESNRDALFARVREATGSDPKTAPQIWINDEYIGGHDELVKWLTK